jgi:hypothetical protein
LKRQRALDALGDEWNNTTMYTCIYGKCRPLSCRLVDVEKLDALKSMFKPFEGTVRSGAQPGTAIVQFADARALQDARARFGGGIRHMFKVAPAEAGANDGAQSKVSKASVASCSTSRSGSEGVQIASNDAQQASSRQGKGQARQGRGKLDFAVARNPFALPGM